MNISYDPGLAQHPDGACAHKICLALYWKFGFDLIAPMPSLNIHLRRD